MLIQVGTEALEQREAHELFYLNLSWAINSQFLPIYLGYSQPISYFWMKRIAVCA